jgi:hypothetical protein
MQRGKWIGPRKFVLSEYLPVLVLAGLGLLYVANQYQSWQAVSQIPASQPIELAPTATQMEGLTGAIEAGDSAAVLGYMARGVNPDRGDGAGRLPLEVAVEHGDPLILKILLANGADPNVATKDGMPLLLLAYKLNQPDAATLMWKEHGASLDSRDREGNSALHWAAFSGDASAVTNLLGVVTSPWLTNFDGKTAADFAREQGHTRLVKVIDEMSTKRRAMAANNE